MPNLNQIFRETIELIKDMLDVLRGRQREYIRALVARTTVRRAVEAFMTAHNVPGVSIAVAQQGRLVFSRGYGFANTTTNEVVTTGHLFRIASLSKPITAVAVFRLIEGGQLQLSDTVFGAGGLLGTTYGTPTGPTTQVGQITVQHLLEHTSGWASSQDPMFAASHLTKSQDDLITWMVGQAPANTPGTTFDYLNFGYLVLGRIIEQVSGMNYANYVQNQVLAPCGISDMHIAGDTMADRRVNEVVYYSQSTVWNPYAIRVSRMDAHGGWIASPTDILRFLVRVDDVPTPPDILNSASIATMFTPTTASGGTANYAKGWAIPSSGIRRHEGDLPGSAGILEQSDANCWAILANTRDDPNLSAMRADLIKVINTIKKGVKAWPKGSPL